MGAFGFAGVALRVRLTCLFAAFVLALLAETRAAFRAGALAVERLAIGLGRALFDLTARPFTDDFVADRRDVERRTPFAMGLLIVIRKSQVTELPRKLGAA